MRVPAVRRASLDEAALAGAQLLSAAFRVYVYTTVPPETRSYIPFSGIKNLLKKRLIKLSFSNGGGCDLLGHLTGSCCTWYRSRYATFQVRSPYAGDDAPSSSRPKRFRDVKLRGG